VTVTQGPDAHWLPVKYPEAQLRYKELTRGIDYNVFRFVNALPHVRALIAAITPAPDDPRIAARMLGKDRPPLEEIFDRMAFRGLTRPLHNHRIRLTKQAEKSKMREISIAAGGQRDFIFEYVAPIVLSVPAHAASYSSELGRSYKTAALAHLPAEMILSFDMKSAFPNVRREYIFDFFYPLTEGADQLVRVLTAGFLTYMSVSYYHEHKKVGLSTGKTLSTHVFNRVLHPLDELLTEETSHRGLWYTRYTDDFVVSSPDVRDEQELFSVLRTLLAHYPIPHSKVFLQQEWPLFIHNYRLRGLALDKWSAEDAAVAKKGRVDDPSVYLPAAWPHIAPIQYRGMNSSPNAV
jgi:hypothetical protein